MGGCNGRDGDSVKDIYIYVYVSEGAERNVGRDRSGDLVSWIPCRVPVPCVLCVYAPDRCRWFFEGKGARYHCGSPASGS